MRSPFVRRPFLMLVATAVVAIVARDLGAGEFNPVLKIGDAAPDWRNLPGTDGKSHSLADYRDKAVLVLFFTCNSCDVATEYEDRIIALARKYSGADSPVAFVAVNVNQIPADSLPEMKQRAEQKGFPFVYVYDETQRIAKDYGATFTPEFFVLNRERKVAYMGGFDDHSSAALAKSPFVADAIAAVARGEQPAKTEAPAIGCMIRFARERRKK